MPYRRRHVRTKAEKLTITISVAVVVLVAVAVLGFLLLGSTIFGRAVEPVTATPPNTLSPSSPRPPPPIIRPPPRQQQRPADQGLSVPGERAPPVLPPR
jgi:hypothetical protein